METRLLSMSMLSALCLAGTVHGVEAFKTDRGWKLVFYLGQDKSARSFAFLSAARGGERFYKSLDSVYELLLKLGCKSLNVVVKQRVASSVEPPVMAASVGARIGGLRTNPELERFHVLNEKNRKGFLTKLERDEFKHLASKFDMSKP